MNRLHELRTKAKRERLTVQENAELLTAIQDKGRREGFSGEDKVELVRTLRQMHLEGAFTTLQKQVRMLLELAGRSPVIRGEQSSVIVGALLPNTEYVVIERGQLDVLLEAVDEQVSLVKNATMDKQGESADSGSGE